MLNIVLSAMSAFVTLVNFCVVGSIAALIILFVSAFMRGEFKK